MKIKTVGHSQMSRSFVSEIRGIVKNKGFQAAWDAIPSVPGFQFEEIDVDPTYTEGRKGIWLGKSTVTKFLIGGE